MAGETDNTDNTQTDFKASYEGLNRGGNGVPDNGVDNPNDIMGNFMKEYMQTLMGGKQTGETGVLDKSTYYPSGDQNVIKGYYEGSMLGRMPLVAPTSLFPWGVVDEQAKQKAMQEQAQNMLEMKSIQDEYNGTKDEVRNKALIEDEMQGYEQLRQKFTDKFGEAKGNILAKNSNEYKMMTMLNRAKAKSFDQMYDRAMELKMEYEGGKADKKGDIYGEHYISADAYNDATTYLHHMHRVTSGDSYEERLENTKELLEAGDRMQVSVGIEKGIANILPDVKTKINSLIVPATYKDGNGVGVSLSTAAENVYDIKNTKGLVSDYFDQDSHVDNGKGGTFTNGEMYYDGLYKKINDKYVPDYKTWKNHAINDCVGGVEDKIEKVATDAAQFQKNYIDQQKVDIEKQKNRPTIKSGGKTIKIGGKTVNVDKNYDISSSAKKNTNLVSAINIIGIDAVTGKPKDILGDVYVGSVFIDEGGALKATVSETPYMAKDDGGNALHKDDDDNWVNKNGDIVDATDVKKDPDAKEYVVDYNTVESTVKTNFNLEDFPEHTTSTKGQGTTQPQKKKPGKVR